MAQEAVRAKRYRPPASGEDRLLLALAALLVVAVVFSLPRLIDVSIAVLLVSGSWWGYEALRRHGATRLRAATVYAVAIVGIAADAIPIGAGWDRVSRMAILIGPIAALLVIVAVRTWPAATVARLGGPSCVWQLLRERARMAFEANRLTNITDAAGEAAFTADLAGLDRYRCPDTAEFISLFQEWHGSTGTPESEQHLADRIGMLEVRLYRSLGAVPAWYRQYPWLDAPGHASHGVLTG